MPFDAANPSVVHALRRSFGQGMSISEFPIRPDLTGIGLTDCGYAPRLSSKLAYRNTFYDREPRLDITDPPTDLEGTLDFLISSDVFEHVPPPVERAFEGVFRLLKPGGVFVLTVPYLLQGETMSITRISTNTKSSSSAGDSHPGEPNCRWDWRYSTSSGSTAARGSRSRCGFSLTPRCCRASSSRFRPDHRLEGPRPGIRRLLAGAPLVSGCGSPPGRNALIAGGS